MSYIDKDATLAAIAQKAKDELADVNHYFLEGVQLAVDVVEGMPSAQPEKRTEKRTKTHACDLISRQAVLKLLAALPPEEVTTKALLIQSVKQMDDAQPEIIRCRECKLRDTEYCNMAHGFMGMKDDDYCSYAERREVSE